MRRETEATVERMERDNDRADVAYERSKGESFMDNEHVAEPFRSIVGSMIDPLGGNLFELHARSERLSIDVARKQMGNDVLRVMLAAKPNGAQAQVDAVIDFCYAESKK